MAEISKNRKQLKRKFISLVDKIEILNRLKNGEKISSVAKSLNLNESTVRTLKKNEEKIRKTIANGCPSGAKRVTRTRHVNMVKMERALMIWLEDCISKKVPVCGNLIKQKALKIYEHFKGVDHRSSERHSHRFTASTGWLQKLKKRYSLHDIKFQGERAEADAEAVKKFRMELPRIIDEGGYAPDQIFNADETTLYWKKLPSRSHISKNERQTSGFKASNQRIALYMCCNLSGSLLMKPMVINFSTPRTFKNIKMSELPVFWRTNKTARMTEDLLKDWFYNCFIPRVASYMTEKNFSFKILLILDNASRYSEELNHPNVKIVYRPNYASLTQSQDQGVIRTFKTYYVRQFFRDIFNRLENHEGKTLLRVWKEFSILDCVRTVSLACAEIKSSTLNACWRPLLPRMVRKGNDISALLAEIVNVASALGSEGFSDINREDIEELLREESLNEEELVESIDESTSNSFVEENADNEFVSNFGCDVKRGLDLAKELEGCLTRNDPSTTRGAKFKREFQNCLAPYKEVLEELQNKATFENREENLQSEKDFLPIRKKRVRLQIFDRDDE
ncbi:PREDICTED: tigger transposable element-derived protein 1-like [Eufriesea mexicana]|uniref:tigger transposable element-derived protein 1-like n=1 Tax=Eufriesea mexicana TaxID=516756 RepID=UPI00083C7D42|nr:PREDICTED: tigger transposable element-derived protein 1-like [Eufriesea mexicana]